MSRKGKLYSLANSPYRWCQTDDAKKLSLELLINTDEQRRWLRLVMDLLVLFFFGSIANDAENHQFNFLSIQMDEGVGFVQKQTYNKI